MKKSTLFAGGLLLVALLALMAVANIVPSGPSTPSLVSGSTENFLAKPIDVQGDLAGVGPFNYTYCGPDCQTAELINNNGNTVTSITTTTSSTGGTESCGTITDVLQHYVCTHTNSNVCITCTTTGTGTATSWCGPLCQFNQNSATTTCGPLCKFNQQHTTTTNTTATTLTGAGQAKIAIVLAAFNNVPPNRTANSIEKEWNDKVVKYYAAISHGKFDASADVFGWYTLPNNEAYYGADCGGFIDTGIACNSYDYSWSLARDAVSVAQYYQNLNLTQYQYLIVMHSGNGQESEGHAYPNDVWSVTYFQGIPAGRDDQHGIFNEYSIVAETERNADPLGIWAAEFGHQQGFPDMFYSTENTFAKTGHWELESRGAWNGSPAGSSPAYTATINQENRGWLQGHFVQAYLQGVFLIINGTTRYTPGNNGTLTITLNTVESNTGNMSIEVIAHNHAAFYWIEARALTGFDKALPSAGVLIGYIQHSVGYDATNFRWLSSHPADTTLDTAAFQVGQTYHDGQVTISIESFSNGVYIINVT